MSTEAQEPARLLIVDDNAMNRDMLSRRLEKRGYSVASADGGHRALELIAAERFDTVLLDIMMPDLNGVEVLRRIRETHSVADLPVIMATAKTQTEDIVEALQSGANDYVTKPLDFPVVLARLETQLTTLRLRRELQRLMKMREEFLAIASHDLKNPLSGVVGFASLITHLAPPGTVMTAEAAEYANRIMKSAQVMQRIITDFLDFQALEDGKLQIERRPVNLNALAAEVVENNRDYAQRKQIEIKAHIDESLPPVEADEPRIAQVIQNFVDNAIKFGPKGTQVRVRTRAADSRAFLEVVDSGPGLTDDDLRKIFVKYARLSNKPTGSEKSSGLGLAICKQMVELHGGEVGVRNNGDAGGATFWFCLPVRTGEPTQPGA